MKNGLYFGMIGFCVSAVGVVFSFTGVYASIYALKLGGYMLVVFGFILGVVGIIRFFFFDLNCSVDKHDVDISDLKSKNPWE
jgi:hypothetical protein